MLSTVLYVVGFVLNYYCVTRFKKRKLFQFTKRKLFFFLYVYVVCVELIIFLFRIRFSVFCFVISLILLYLFRIITISVPFFYIIYCFVIICLLLMLISTNYVFHSVSLQSLRILLFDLNLLFEICLLFFTSINFKVVYSSSKPVNIKIPFVFCFIVF